MPTIDQDNEVQYWAIDLQNLAKIYDRTTVELATIDLLKFPALWVETASEINAIRDYINHRF